jgi:flavin-dependent dehydrogenase
MIVGDAGFITKPFSGEGVTSGFTACRIAVDTADAALRTGDTGRRALWGHNVRYFRDQGAKFAGLLAQLNIATGLSRSDINYLFKQDIIFSSFDFESMNRDFEVRLGPGRLLSVAMKLVKGRLGGALSKEGFGALLAAMKIAGKMRAHYEAYPEDPDRLDAWAAKARELYGES